MTDLVVIVAGFFLAAGLLSLVIAVYLIVGAAQKRHTGVETPSAPPIIPSAGEVEGPQRRRTMFDPPLHRPESAEEYRRRIRTQLDRTPPGNGSGVTPPTDQQPVTGGNN